MVMMINPFDTAGYTLAEMTEAINILPNVYSRLGQMGLFRFEGVTQRSVVIEQAEGVLNLLPTVPLGGPATVASRELRSMRPFTKLTRMRVKHAQTREYMEVNALRGIVKDGAGTTAAFSLRRHRLRGVQRYGHAFPRCDRDAGAGGRGHRLPAGHALYPSSPTARQPT